MLVTLQAVVLDAMESGDPYNVGEVRCMAEVMKIGNRSKFICVFQFLANERHLMQERLSLLTKFAIITVDGEFIGTNTIMVHKWCIEDGPIFIGRKIRFEYTTIKSMVNDDRMPENQYEIQALDLLIRSFVLKIGVSFQVFAENPRLKSVAMDYSAIECQEGEDDYEIHHCDHAGSSWF